MDVGHENLKRLIEAAKLPDLRVDEDERDGQEWNRHIVFGGSLRLCFMAHNAGFDPKADEARAYLIANGLNALPDLLAENERLREALEPFARAADRVHEATDSARLIDPFTNASGIKVGDLRRACKALIRGQP